MWPIIPPVLDSGGWLLITLGTVVMVLSTVNTWVERQLLDTDSWVHASTALLEDDDVSHLESPEATYHRILARQ